MDYYLTTTDGGYVYAGRGLQTPEPSIPWSVKPSYYLSQGHLRPLPPDIPRYVNPGRKYKNLSVTNHQKTLNETLTKHRLQPRHRLSGHRCTTPQGRQLCLGGNRCAPPQSPFLGHRRCALPQRSMWPRLGTSLFAPPQRPLWPRLGTFRMAPPCPPQLRPGGSARTQRPLQSRLSGNRRAPPKSLGTERPKIRIQCIHRSSPFD